MPKVTQYITVIGSELIALYTAFQNLAPASKTFITDELAAAGVELKTVETALASFASASTVGKIAAGLSLLNVFGGFITFIETTYKNGEALFASDWPSIKAPIDNLVALFSGNTTQATPAAAAPATVDPTVTQ